jgi:fumarylacetoacetate (FAA) hydrolase family protein
MNEVAPIKSLTVRNDEAQVKLVEAQVALTLAKAKLWRAIAAIGIMLVLAMVAAVLGLATYGLLSLTPWV